MTDVIIYENGNGGELSLKNGDIETTDSLCNQPYLAHFGGNVEANTTDNEIEGEERNDWWGNTFLDGEAQMNSNLERSLNKNALNSSGRANIEAAAVKDLEYLSEIAKTESIVSLKGVNKLLITDKLNQSVVNLAWDATKNELIQEITI